MRLKIHENQSRINSTGDEKFELNDVRFEDEGVITCRAENVFGVQETEVELTVLGNFLFYFYFFLCRMCHSTLGRTRKFIAPPWYKGGGRGEG